MTFVDPTHPVHIGCGVQVPIRSAAFTALLGYTRDPAHAPSAVDGKRFEFNAIVITTHGRWRFSGAAGVAEIESDTLVVGVVGDEYGCRHRPLAKDGDIVVALRPGALDPNYPPLFAKRVVPADSALRMAQRAADAVTADGFDSQVFSLFDDVVARSDDGRRLGSRLRAQRAKRFIELHAYERIGLGDIAAEVGLSPFTLSHEFRAATGRSPYAYLLELRLARAKRLLATTGNPVTAVGTSVGFDELAHFSRWFARATGVPPSVYRMRERS